MKDNDFSLLGCFRQSTINTQTKAFLSFTTGRLFSFCKVESQKLLLAGFPHMGIFTGIAYRLSLQSRRGTARRKAFASHSIRRAVLAVLTKKPPPTPTPCGIRIDVLDVFGIEAFQRMPRARAPLVPGQDLFFVALCFPFVFT